MLPIFLIDNPDEEQEIASMPGVKRMGINAAVKFLDPLVNIGLKSVLLFAVTAAEKVRDSLLIHLSTGDLSYLIRQDAVGSVALR